MRMRLGTTGRSPTPKTKLTQGDASAGLLQKIRGICSGDIRFRVSFSGDIGVRVPFFVGMI